MNKKKFRIFFITTNLILFFSFSRNSKIDTSNGESKPRIFKNIDKATPVKAVFLDLYGTLLNNKRKISNKNKTIIQKVRQKGILVGIATGAMPKKSIKKYYNELELDGPTICMNGAYIFDFKKNKLIKEEKIPLFLLPKLEKMVNKLNKKHSLKDKDFISILYYREKNWFTNKFSLAIKEKARSRKRSVEIIPFEEMLKTWKKENINPLKIKILCNNKNLSIKIYEKIQKEFKNNLNILKSQNNSLSITSSNASKGKAIKFLINKFHPTIKRENVLAIGNNENDISMLNWVGFGIAMENAASHIKEISFDTTLSNEEDGVAEALEKHILKNYN